MTTNAHDGDHDGRADEVRQTGGPDESGPDESGADEKGRARAEAEERRAAQREALLEERRARQMGGGKGGRGQMFKLAMLGGCAAVAMVIVIGPTAGLRMLGMGEDETAQKASNVDLEVEKQVDHQLKMDFLTPEGPEEPPAADPNREWNKRFETLQKELEAVARANSQPEVSLGDVNDLLKKYNEQMSDKLAEERRKMSSENDRLRKEAARLEEEMRRREAEAQKEEQRRKEMQDTEKLRRQSQGVLLDESGTARTASGSMGGSAAGPALSYPDDQDVNERFLASAAGSGFETSASENLTDPSRTVVQGTIISAVLETAINTELPGNIRAQVMEPVFSFDGTRILMPRGTILIGTFNNEVDVAQKRVLIAWNRAVTPEGKSIALGSTGTDLLGRSGTAGNVDNRLTTKFGAGLLISTISAIPAAVGALLNNDHDSRGGTTINIGAGAGSGASGGGNSAAQQAASGIAGQMSEQSQGILEKYLSLPPVIRIPQGEEIRVFVNRDLVFR
jgi:type IV secretion system protein VirB10